jgi:peptidoglycan/xylan/chitin deacetylase (PgdA/CDA1 family)
MQAVEPPEWPNGARCAAAITFDVDVDTLIHVTHPGDSHRYVNTISWLRYDTVGLPRILDLLAGHGLKQTFFFPAWCMEQYPELVDAVQQGGHELGLHGYLHEWPNRLSVPEERSLIRRSLEVFESVAGTRPVGWRAPWGAFSESSAELLIEEGFIYDSSLMGDEIPYILQTEAGQLVEVPIEMTMDDFVQYTNMGDLGFMMPIRPPEYAMKVFLAEFDAAWEEGGMWIAHWHPSVSGRRSRLREIAKAIDYIQSRGDVWFASLREIAEHVGAAQADGTYQPRVDRLPYLTSPPVPS